MDEAFERFLNVVDVEATCWAGDPPDGESSEIIEIGVCVVDTHGWRRTERRRILVRPRGSRVGAFCTELTGLTQADVDAGVDFATACAGLPLEGRHHRGDDDAWNIGALVVDLARRGRPVTAPTG